MNWKKLDDIYRHAFANTLHSIKISEVVETMMLGLLMSYITSECINIQFSKETIAFCLMGPLFFFQ